MHVLILCFFNSLLLVLGLAYNKFSLGSYFIIAYSNLKHFFFGTSFSILTMIALFIDLFILAYRILILYISYQLNIVL